MGATEAIKLFFQVSIRFYIGSATNTRPISISLPMKCAKKRNKLLLITYQTRVTEEKKYVRTELLDLFSKPSWKWLKIIRFRPIILEGGVLAENVRGGNDFCMQFIFGAEQKVSIFFKEIA